MQGNRSRETKPELALRSPLHRRGFDNHPTKGILVAYQYNYGDQTINPANYVRHDQDAKN